MKVAKRFFSRIRRIGKNMFLRTVVANLRSPGLARKDFPTTIRQVRRQVFLRPERSKEKSDEVPRDDRDKRGM